MTLARGRNFRLPPIRPFTDQQALTGTVQGRKASAEEERVARALRLINLTFRFQYEIRVMTSLPGQGKLIDFIVFGLGRPQPMEVDGAIGHSTAAQKGADAIRDALLAPVIARAGWKSLIRIPAWKLSTQAEANRTMRQVFVT